MYAYPALKICASADEKKISELENFMIHGKAPEKAELEKIFPRAFGRIRRLAERLHQDSWTLETLKAYWLREHNRIIDAGEDEYCQIAHKLREVCKVKFVKVLDFHTLNSDKWEVKIDYEGKEINSEAYFQPSVGQIVSMHLGKIVELISQDDLEKYGKN